MKLLNQVPDNWIRTSVGKFCDVQLGKMLQNDPSSDRDQIKPYLRAINIGKARLDLTHEFSMWIRPQEADRFRLRRSDVLVSEGGDAGRTVIFNTDSEYYFQNAINRIRPDYHGRIESDFIYYWFTFLKAIGYVEMICNVATIPHFTAEKVKAAPLALPPLPTQRRIVQFLDEKTARIDALIEKKRELLDRLAEKRQALITRAVTKGLDPDVQRGNCRVAEGAGGMKLLNQVPDNWIRTSVGKFCDVQLGKMLQNDPSSDRDQIKPYLRAINIGKARLDLTHEFSMWIRPQEADRFRLRRSDVLVSEGGDAGRTVIFNTDSEYYFQNAINRIRPDYHGRIESDFIYYWFTFLKAIGYVEMICNVATIPHFTAEKVKVAPLALPPLQTQHRIVQFLDEKTAQIDEAESQILSSMDLLSEYRAALITAAVTGQIASLSEGRC